MSKVKTYKWCIVPKCASTTTSSPGKLFFLVPFEIKARKKWMQVIRRVNPPRDKSAVYCCENHFDIENDMDNYIKFSLVGGRKLLKKGVVPHKFECQKLEDKKETPVSNKQNEKVFNEDSSLLKLEPEEIFDISSDDDSVVEDRLKLQNNLCKNESKRHRAVQVSFKNNVKNKATNDEEKYFKRRKSTKIKVIH